MTWKNLWLAIIVIVSTALTTLAQVSASTSTGAGVPSKIGVVNVQNVVGATNDGRKSFQALEEKFSPKKIELKSLTDDIENLKKQLEVQSSKLNDETRSNLSQEIDSKQKKLAREQEDAQSDFSEQQGQIVSKILQKVLPIVEKYATENNFTLIIDGSKPWPEWPVLWASPTVDITKHVLDIYNEQSASASSFGTHPEGTKPQARPEKMPQSVTPRP